MGARRNVSAWWYAIAVVIGVATLVGVLWTVSGSGRRSLSSLAPRGIGYVDDGHVDSVVKLTKGPYSLVYLSDTLTSRDRVPKADIQVRGGPIDDIRTLKVRNNPTDAAVFLSYDYSTSTGGYGSPTTVGPSTIPPVGGAGGTGGSSTTVPYSSGVTAFTRGRAEIAVFTVPADGEYRVSGRITGQPDPRGVLAVYHYRLRDESQALTGGVLGFFGRIGLAVLIGVVGTGLVLASALVVASMRSRAKPASYGWAAPQPAWVPAGPGGPDPWGRPPPPSGGPPSTPAPSAPSGPPQEPPRSPPTPFPSTPVAPPSAPPPASDPWPPPEPAPAEARPPTSWPPPGPKEP